MEAAISNVGLHPWVTSEFPKSHSNNPKFGLQTHLVCNCLTIGYQQIPKALGRQAAK